MSEAPLNKFLKDFEALHNNIFKYSLSLVNSYSLRLDASSRTLHFPASGWSLSHPIIVKAI